MNIRIITTTPLLAEELCELLNSHGFCATSVIDETCTTYAMKTRSSLKDIRELNVVRDIIKPFQVPCIEVSSLHKDVDLEIYLASTMDEHDVGVQIVCNLEDEETISKLVLKHKLGICAWGHSDVNFPSILYGKDDPFIAAYLAWVLKMPRETLLQYEPDAGPLFRVNVSSDWRLEQIRRRQVPITIRSDDPKASQALYEKLLRAGYQTVSVFIAEGRILNHVNRFGISLDSIPEHRVLMPSFQWLASDLTKVVSSWLEEMEVDLTAFPFEQIEWEQLDGYDSMVIDLPWHAYQNGRLPAYGFGHPGRYRATLISNNPDAADPLALMLEDNLGMNGVALWKKDGIREYELIFSGEILNDEQAQRLLARAVRHYMQQQGINEKKLMIRRSSEESYPITIWFPANEIDGNNKEQKIGDR